VNAGFLARIVPRFAPLLWPGDGPAPLPAAGANDDAGNVAQRMKHPLASVLRVVRERGTLLLMFIDDLQWADVDSLDLLESVLLEDSHAPVLIVGAYRDNEVDAMHPLTQMLARIAASPTRLVALTIYGLSEEAVRAMVADALDAEHVDVIGLAHALHAKTEGNAFFVLEYLRRLFADGHLSRPYARRRWDDAALQALPDSENLVSGLLREFERLPDEVRQAAGVCACLGTEFDVSLLAAALGLTPGRTEDLLVPLIQREMLRAAPDAGNGGQSLRFGHDRMQQAAYGLLDTEARARTHLAIARALHGSAERETAGFALAGHYFDGLTEIPPGPERAKVLEILMDAAQRAQHVGSFESGLRFADGAMALTRQAGDSAAEPAPDPAIVFRLEDMRHLSLYSLVRRDEADAAFERLRSSSVASAVTLSHAAGRQIASLTVRGRYPEGFALMVDMLRLLKIDVPSPDGWEAAGRDELRALRARATRRDRRIRSARALERRAHRGRDHADGEHDLGRGHAGNAGVAHRACLAHGAGARLVGVAALHDAVGLSGHRHLARRPRHRRSTGPRGDAAGDAVHRAGGGGGHHRDLCDGAGAALDPHEETLRMAQRSRRMSLDAGDRAFAL
jgi:hypothetical protein